MLQRTSGMRIRAQVLKTITTATMMLPLVLSSCSSASQPANTLYIAYSIRDDQFTRSAKERFEKRIHLSTQLFLKTNPNTRVVTTAYKASRMKDQISEDSRLNLGPDLIVGIDFVLRNLYEDSLISDYPNSSQWTQQYDQVIKDLSFVDNKLAFAPYGILPQVSCYNNKAVKQSPKTLQDLVELGASGVRIGLSTLPHEIFWTAGSTGAIPEISALMTNTNQNKAKPKIKKWVTWLRQAATYQNISFYNQQSELIEELATNNLDWISCNSSDVQELKETMGEQLSIAILPNGIQSKAFAWPFVSALGLGTDSSPAQRALALSYVKSNTNAVGQRQLMLQTEDFLPANKDVDIPNQSSQILKAYNDSWNKQSLSHLKEWPMILQYLGTSGNYLKIKTTLNELTSGIISTDEAQAILTNLNKQAKG